MPVICPAILAADLDAYHAQMEHIAKFAQRIQIDLTDGEFTSSKTVSPNEAWWPVGIKPDFHLMYKDPVAAVGVILEHQPHMIIIHAEAEGDFKEVVRVCRTHSVKVGVALLPGTSEQVILPALGDIDHVLIFSGELGEFGGNANLEFLDKISSLKSAKPNLEFGWDGGINDQNAAELILGGVDVLNCGGFIQKSDNPERAFHILKRIADETGTT